MCPHCVTMCVTQTLMPCLMMPLSLLSIAEAKYKKVKLDTLHRFYSFWIPIFTVTEEEVLKSCGVDAMMLLRTCTLGIQLFLPLSILGCAIILPINLNGNYVNEQVEQGVAAGSQYM
jgi:hypothetical protein